MDWIIDKNRPICPQISEQLCLEIAKGKFEPFEKLPSVREIAMAAGVNPNTVQRSLDELERSGVIYSVRSSGWFVSEVVLFMAFVAISNFTQASFDMGYAIKLSRTFILILTGLFKVWGFAAGSLIVLTVIANQ